MTTHNEAAIERSVRAGCDAVDPHLRCSFPECGCKTNPRIVRAALAALLAEHDRRVTELLAANTAEVERRRAAEAQADRMRPIVQQVGEAWLGASRDVTASDDRVFVTALEYGAGRAAAALVREREENEETARWGHETMPLSPAPVEPQP